MDPNTGRMGIGGWWSDHFGSGGDNLLWNRQHPIRSVLRDIGYVSNPLSAVWGLLRGHHGSPGFPGYTHFPGMDHGSFGTPGNTGYQWGNTPPGNTNVGWVDYNNPNASQGSGGSPNATPSPTNGLGGLAGLQGPPNQMGWNPISNNGFGSDHIGMGGPSDYMENTAAPLFSRIVK